MIKKSHVRIKDIARLAGVSEGTVDRVLHKRGKVSKDALDKVVKVLDQIEYTPNLLARTLSSNRKYRLALLVPDPNLDSYWEQSAHGVSQGVAEFSHFGVSVDPFYFDLHEKSSFHAVSQHVLKNKPDGIVIAPLFYREAIPYLQHLRQLNIPFILFNTFIPEAQPLTFIGQDLYQSGKLAASLLNLGQPNSGQYYVFHIDEDLENSVHLVSKEKGFRDYFTTATLDDVQVITISLNSGDENFTRQIEAIASDQTTRGIFVSTSKTYHVAQVLESIGKRSIRLIGYDLVEENIKFLRKGIIDFLIHQNPRLQAFQSVKNLVHFLLFKQTPKKTNLFPLEIITRLNLDSHLAKEIF